MENQEKIVELFAYTKDAYSPKQIVKTSLNYEEKLIEIRQTLSFKITVEDMRKDIDFLEDKLRLNELSISIHSIDINDISDIERLNYQIEENGFSDNYPLRMTIAYVEKKFLPLNNNTAFYYFLDDLPLFMNEISSNLKVKDLKLLKNKISIYSNIKNNYQTSSIFCLSDFLNKQEEKFNETLLELLSNPFLKSMYCKILPDIYFFDDNKYLSSSAIDMFILLSDRNENNELYFIGHNTKIISISDGKLKFGDNYKILSEIITFIYSGNNMQIKLSLVKNLIYDKLEDKSSLSVITETWLKTVKKRAEMEYKLFIDEEVNKFISEKRDIIKDQFDLSYQIIEESNGIRKNLLSNIVYVVGFFISSFLIEGINNESGSFRNIAVLTSFILAVFILIFNIINGEFASHASFENKIKLINEQYPKMYLTEETLIDDLNEQISSPEIIRLKKTEIIALIIYVLLAMVSFIACLILYWDVVIDLVNIIQSKLKNIINLTELFYEEVVR